MNEAHTPRPWWLATRTDGSARPNVLDTFTVFHGPHGPAADNQICAADTVANARLIAAAPDLLAACQAAADLLLRCDAEIMPSDLVPATDEDWDRVAAQLAEVIGKAEVQP